MVTTLPEQSPGQSLPAVFNTRLFKSSDIQLFQKSVNGLLRVIKIIIFQKLSYILPCPSDLSKYLTVPHKRLPLPASVFTSKYIRDLWQDIFRNDPADLPYIHISSEFEGSFKSIRKMQEQF